MLQSMGSQIVKHDWVTEKQRVCTIINKADINFCKADINFCKADINFCKEVFAFN